MEEIKKLVAEIAVAATAYEYTDTPIISDEEFNAKVDRLRELDPSNKILFTPGWGAVSPSHKEKKPHTFLVYGFDTKIQSVVFQPEQLPETYVQSAKLDGLAIVAYYNDYDPRSNTSKFSFALTRNDGKVGLDVSSSLRGIKFPREVPGEINWVRGEVVTTWEATKKFDYSHPRNMACGLVNSDTLDEAHKELSFVVYNFDGDLPHNRKLEILEDIGFEVVRWTYGKSESDFNSHVNKFDYSNFNSYEKYKYPVDGSIITDNESGEGFAIKYPTEIVEVKVLSIVNQLSSRGRVIPVIEFEPVFLAGAMLNYCSGFNWMSIRDQGVGPGAVIKITRANEVIPDWVSTVSKGDCVVPASIEYEGVTYPTHWEGSHLEVKIDKTPDCIKTLLSWKCPHGVGQAKVIDLVKHFDIKTPEELVIVASNVGGMHNRLHELFGGTYQGRMIELLEAVNTGFTMAELLEATYSRNMGAEASDRLMKHYQNNPELMLEDLYRTHYRTREEITGEWDSDLESFESAKARLGSVRVITDIKIPLPEAVVDNMPTYVVGVGIEENRELITAVLSAGFNMTAPPVEVDTTSLIKICLTGTLSKSRGELLEEWKQYAVESDVKVAKYLITNNPGSGSSKIKTAEKLGMKVGVDILTEEEFRSIIGA